MTNAQIIFTEEQRLAEEGKIKYTGRVFEMEDSTGEKIQLKETERIHTFAAWKEMGFIVQKGQKAITQIMIWKHVGKTNKETGEDESKMFMKKASFFSQSQVERIA